MRTGEQVSDRPDNRSPLPDGMESSTRKRTPHKRGETAPRSHMYPAVLKLAGRRCLVAGGGEIALRKASELVRCGARVRLVAPEWRADFASLDREPGVSRDTRPFRPSDLNGVFLVVAATDDARTQEEVWSSADRRGTLCNVVDVPKRCNFFVPATLRRGSLAVSVSTEGKSPLLAVAVRDRLASLLGPHLAQGLERLAAGRQLVRALYPADPDSRREANLRLLPPEVVDQLLEGDIQAFEAHWKRWKSSLSA